MTTTDNTALNRFRGKPLIYHTVRCIQQAAASGHAAFSSQGVTIQPFIGSDASKTERLEAQEFIYLLKELGYFDIHTLDHIRTLSVLHKTPQYNEAYTLIDISPQVHRLNLLMQSSASNTPSTTRISFINDQLIIGAHKAIDIRRNTRTHTILGIILRNIDEPHKEWSWDELTEQMGEDPENRQWRSRIYKAGYDLNAKCSHIDPPCS